VAAGSFAVVDWGVMSKIAASWFISPILGGIIAAGFLAAIEATIFSKRDMVAAGRKWVPLFLGIMVAAFAVYLITKGLKKVWKPDALSITAIGIFFFITASAALRPVIGRAVKGIENRRAGVNSLFNIPLIFAAALLSFAHGANDVANAVGPLSAIVSVAQENAMTAKVGIPIWVMLIGATGISIGLWLFGAKLIRTVGKRLTRLDQTRAFCICLSAAITVIGASSLGLPVSSTHIAIGSVFGIGIYREYKCKRKSPNCRPRKLFRRRELLTIGSAWLITVPSAAMIAAILYKLMSMNAALMSG
jgi:PiT family inorganic phosphate transporter